MRTAKQTYPEQFRTINKGPELLVKLSNLSHSEGVQIPFSLKSATIFAPIGYPLIIPIIKGYEPSPGTLKIGRIHLCKSFPKNGTIEVWLSKFVAIKKGSKEGTTEFIQRLSPSFSC